MKSADEAETGLPPRTVEGRLPPSMSEDTGGGNAAVPAPEGDAARVVSLPPSSDAVISVPSIANLTVSSPLFGSIDGLESFILHYYITRSQCESLVFGL